MIGSPLHLEEEHGRQTAPISADAVVVGGGVVGTACAYHLSVRGVRVVLIEKSGLAAGSSSATQSQVGYGLGGDGDHLDFQIAAMAAYNDLVRHGVQFDFDQSGTVVVPEGGPDEEALQRAVESRRARGLQCRWVSAAELADIEPEVATAGSGGAFLPELAQVSPMNLAVELARQAILKGARVTCNTALEAIEFGPHHSVAAVQTSRGRVTTRRLVLATGSWSRVVGRLAGLEVPVWPRKGHILVSEPAPHLLRRPVVDFGYGHDTVERLTDSGPLPGPAETFGVLQPLPTGQLLIGGSRQFAGLDMTIDHRVVRAIARRAIHMVPSLRDVRVIRTYIGFRPWTPDGSPIIGPSRRASGLIFATGHGGEGVTESVVTGEIVADFITGQVSRVDVRRLAPDRFEL
jgi:glycine/D-amino acid oxidase-like deaminating enzyme